MPGEEFGNNYRAVFSGDLRADFTVVGRRTWTFLRYCPWSACPPVQELTMVIDFTESGVPILVLRDAPLRDAAGAPQTLERFSDSTQVPPPP